MTMYETSKCSAIMADAIFCRKSNKPEILISPKLWHRHSTMANSQEVYLGDSNNDWQSVMAAETENTYISETKKGIVKILTTNVGYKTMCRCKIVSISKQRPTTENIDMAARTRNTHCSTYLELWQIASKVQRQIRDFQWCPAQKKISQLSTTRNCMIGEQNVYIVISGCRSLSQSPGFSFFVPGVVENPRFAVGIVIISVVVPDI